MTIKKASPPAAPPLPTSTTQGLKKIQFPQSQRTKGIRKKTTNTSKTDQLLMKLETFATQFTTTDVGSAWEKKLHHFRHGKGKMEFNILVSTKSPQMYDIIKYHTASISDLSYYDYTGAVAENTITIPLSSEGHALNDLLTHTHEALGIKKRPPLVTALQISPQMQENAKQSRKDLMETIGTYQEEIRTEVRSTVTQLIEYYHQLLVLFDNPSTSSMNAARQATRLMKQSTTNGVLDVPGMRHQLYTAFQSGLQTYCRSNKNMPACSILEKTTPLFARMKTLAELYTSATEFGSKFEALETSLADAYAYMKPLVKGLFRNANGPMSLESKRSAFVKILDMYELEINDIVRSLPQKLAKKTIAKACTVKATDIKNASPTPMPGVQKVSKTERDILELQREIQRLKDELKTNDEKALRLEAQVARMASNGATKNQNISSKTNQIHALQKQNIMLEKKLRMKNRRARLLRLSLISIALPSSLLAVFGKQQWRSASTALVPLQSNGSMQIGNASFNIKRALNVAQKRSRRSTLPYGANPIHMGPASLLALAPAQSPARSISNTTAKANSKIMYTSSVAATAVLALALAKMARRSSGGTNRAENKEIKKVIKKEIKKEIAASSPPIGRIMTRRRSKKKVNCIGCKY